MMPYDVIEARHVAGFVLWLRFRDGTAARIALRTCTGPRSKGACALHHTLTNYMEAL
jgi:hypothetical protein